VGTGASLATEVELLVRALDARLVTHATSVSLCWQDRKGALLLMKHMRCVDPEMQSEMYAPDRCI